VSRFYRTGYNALAVLVMLPPLSSLTPFAYLPKGASVLALALLYSVVKVLLFSSYIIQQKELLFIKRMNLYFHDILGGAFFKKQKGSPLV